MLNILGVLYFWDTLYRYMKHTLAITKHLSQSYQKNLCPTSVAHATTFRYTYQKMGLLDEMWDQFYNFL